MLIGFLNKLMSKIVVYATDKNGSGFVQSLGEYENIEDISIRVGMFSSDIVISLERVTSAEE